MFAKILRFELAYQLRRPVFYLGLAGTVIFVFLFVLAIVGNANDAQAGTKLNSPVAAARLFWLISLFSLLIPLSLFADPGLRDAEVGMEELVRATPVKLPSLLLARFLAAFILTTLIYLSAIPIIELALHASSADAAFAGPFRPSAYAATFAYLVVPNLFVFGSAVFAAALWTRSSTSGYALVVLFVALIMVGKFTGLRVYAWANAMIDPLGFNALEQITRYWSPAQLNANALPFEGMLLWNRLFWVGLGCMVLFATVAFLPRAVGGGRASATDRAGTQPSDRSVSFKPVRPGLATVKHQLLLRLRFETGFVLRSWTFLFMVAMLVGGCVLLLYLPDAGAALPSLPTTETVAPKVAIGASLGGLMILFLAGELMWRERRSRITEILDATPAPAFVFLAGKLGALAIALAVCSPIAIAIGAGYQLRHGVTDIGLGTYVAYMALQFTVPTMMDAVLVMFVHALAPNKYVGHLLVLCLVAAMVTAAYFGFEDELMQFGSIPQLPLSAMNGLGHYLEEALWFLAYWGSATVLLGIAIHLLWPRGQNTALLERLRSAPFGLTPAISAVAAFALFAMAGTGVYIYWNTHIRNAYYTARDVEAARADYERAFAPHVWQLQPRIAEIDMAVDIDPASRILTSRGQYRLVNRSNRPIETVRVQFDNEFKVERVEIAQAALISERRDFNDFVFQPHTPLKPGETLTVAFAGTMSNAGFRHGEEATPINGNGTFVHSMLFAPWIGVAEQFFLTDAAQRRRAGLSPVNLAEDENTGGESRNFLARDSDFVGFGLTLSTSIDQIAVAPGILKREWVEAGRRYFRFEAERPINNFWAVQSARYAVTPGTWGNVELAVYHDPDQRRNVPPMLAAMQEALAYYTKTYGPFSYRQLRVAEFPYGAYAQSFPSAISYAEALGFSIDGPAGRKVDYVGFVTAHEVAHQWWGHQAVPADKPGAQFLSETLAEYSALMVMEKRYGPDHIRNYLKTDLDQYLSHRGQSDAEQPLAKVLRHQAHIAYQKGALAMYALKDTIGQQAMDRALRRYLERYRDKSSPYPTAADLIGILREEAGPDHQSLITDLFEKIIFWEFKATNAVATFEGQGRWRVMVTVTSDKKQATPMGAETSVPLNDTVDIGLFAADPSAEGFTPKDVIALEKRVVTGGTGSFVFYADRKPAFAGINPYLKLIEQQSQDNVVAVTQ